MFFWGYLQEITLIVIVIVSPQLQPDLLLKIIEGGFVQQQASQVAGGRGGGSQLEHWYCLFDASTDEMWIVGCLLFITYNSQQTSI